MDMFFGMDLNIFAEKDTFVSAAVWWWVLELKTIFARVIGRYPPKSFITEYWDAAFARTDYLFRMPFLLAAKKTHSQHPCVLDCKRALEKTGHNFVGNIVMDIFIGNPLTVSIKYK